MTIPNIRVLNAILYVAEHGCKWRGLPSRFGNWHTVYMRMNRWAKSGVLDRVFEQLQRKGIVKVTIEVASLDSTSVKVHPDGTGAAKKTDHSPSASPEADGRPSFIWLPRMIGHPWRSRSLRARPTMDRRGANCSTGWGHNGGIRLW